MGVKLEILRMVVYLSFPVGVFWVSNQAEFFQRHVIDRKVGEGTPGDRRAMAELKQRLDTRAPGGARRWQRGHGSDRGDTTVTEGTWQWQRGRRSDRRDTAATEGTRQWQR
uniref:Uncharacterized protein n=1 Tax=Corvus moneduloides TaxID=1196302 RepID=A0A8U7NLX2_CORMO